ncbi:MAG: carbohydrate ABC transporter permease [Phycicoccus sp.]
MADLAGVPTVPVRPRRPRRAHLTGAAPRHPRHPFRPGRRAREGWTGILLVAPAVVGLAVFVVYPIGLMAWVSLTDWSGLTSPFSADPVGTANYEQLLLEEGLSREDLGIAIRNTFYYVLGVVPAQTALAFVLASVLNQRWLRGRVALRTAYYLPSVTSSVAMALVFIFLFQPSGFVNGLLPGRDLVWLDDPRGLLHLALGAVGVDGPPQWLAEVDLLGIGAWDWLSGPSITMTALMLLVTWSTTGTFMLVFLAGLQRIPVSVEEAAMLDGASAVQRFRYITLPLMRPVIAFVVSIGLIGTWQVFDQIWVISSGGPRRTTLTPAYLMYVELFDRSNGGLAAAIAVLLFAIIIVFTLVQRRVSARRREEQW